MAPQCWNLHRRPLFTCTLCRWAGVCHCLGVLGFDTSLFWNERRLKTWNNTSTSVIFELNFLLLLIWSDRTARQKVWHKRPSPSFMDSESRPHPKTLTIFYIAISLWHLFLLGTFCHCFSFHLSVASVSCHGHLSKQRRIASCFNKVDFIDEKPHQLDYKNGRREPQEVGFWSFWLILSGTEQQSCGNWFGSQQGLRRFHEAGPVTYFLLWVVLCVDYSDGNSPGVISGQAAWLFRLLSPLPCLLPHLSFVTMIPCSKAPRNTYICVWIFSVCFESLELVMSSLSTFVAEALCILGSSASMTFVLYKFCNFSSRESWRETLRLPLAAALEWTLHSGKLIPG